MSAPTREGRATGLTERTHAGHQPPSSSSSSSSSSSFSESGQAVMVGKERKDELAEEIMQDYERRSRLLRRALLSFAGTGVIYVLACLAVDGRLVSPIGCISFMNSIISLILYFYFTSNSPLASDDSRSRLMDGSLRTTSILFAIQKSITVTVIFSFYHSQPYADVTHWLVLIPLYMLYILGSRAGFIATVMITLQAVALQLFAWNVGDSGDLTTCSIPLPIWNVVTNWLGILECDTLSSHFHSSPLGRALNMFTFVLCVGVVSFAYEDTRRSTFSFLQRSNERLHRATAAKAQFLANMTHELRTPMHGIVSMAKELLENVQLDSKGIEAVQIISDSSDHLLSLVNDILDYESLEAGKLTLEHIPFSLGKETSKVVSLVSVLAQQKDIRLDKNLSIHHDMRMGDPLRFRQILYNLLANAIKFTHECGYVSVTVVDNPDEEGVRIEVHDTGIGIDEYHRHNIFKMYSQTAPDIRRKFGGSGLGLAICKGLCESMGGDIRFESQPGEGTTFICEISLPFSITDHDFEEEKREQQVNAIREIGPVLKGARVLLVEDNVVSQKVGVKILNKLGVSVQVASNGSECLRLARSQRFDAILMDCQMPVMDGFEATRILRNLEASGDIPRTPRRRRASRQVAETSESRVEGDPSHSAAASDRQAKTSRKQSKRVDVHAHPKDEMNGIPVIALTASATIEVQNKCFKSGMDDLLLKPFRRDELARVLLEWTGVGIASSPPTSADEEEPTSSS